MFFSWQPRFFRASMAITADPPVAEHRVNDEELPFRNVVLVTSRSIRAASRFLHPGTSQIKPILAAGIKFGHPIDHPQAGPYGMAVIPSTIPRPARKIGMMATFSQPIPFEWFWQLAFPLQRPLGARFTGNFVRHQG